MKHYHPSIQFIPHDLTFNSSFTESAPFGVEIFVATKGELMGEDKISQPPQRGPMPLQR